MIITIITVMTMKTRPIIMMITLMMMTKVIMMTNNYTHTHTQTTLFKSIHQLISCILTSRIGTTNLAHSTEGLRLSFIPSHCVLHGVPAGTCVGVGVWGGAAGDPSYIGRTGHS